MAPRFVLRFFLTALLLSAIPANSQSKTPILKLLPSPLQWLNEPAQWKLDSSDAVAITAGKSTDWFVSPIDAAVTASSPKLLFEPAEDFVFSTKLTVDFRSTWDAGVLVLYRDPANWAKLCFEMTVDKQPSIVSVVTREISDDNVSIAVAAPSVYLKIAKTGKAIFFYVSRDGRSWQMIRAFRLDGPAPLRAGFSSQSPTGEGCQTVFSEIRYEARRITNIWTGE